MFSSYTSTHPNPSPSLKSPSKSRTATLRTRFYAAVGNFLTENRNLVIIVIVLPLGFLFDLFVRLSRDLSRLFARPSTHAERVAVVCRAVSSRNADPLAKRKPMCTARANWMNLSTRAVNKTVLNAIPTGHLYHILDIDAERQTCTVEPMVTMGVLSAYLAKRGWFFATTIEMDDVTVGGAALAVGMTTHSHRVGLISENVLLYEVVLGSGSVVTATADENPDLFYALPWSHGTLGFVTKLVLRIVPAKEFVALTYTPIDGGRDEYARRFREVSERAAVSHAGSPDYFDFIEMTVCSPAVAVLITGTFADRAADRTESLVRQGRWWSEWWFRRVQDIGTRGCLHRELMPLRDYLLRHNRSIFWVAADMVNVGNSFLFRYLLGWMMPPKPSFLKFTTTPAVRKMNFTHLCFQDITFPMSALEESLSTTDRLFDMYPLLLYPCRLYDHGRGAQGQGQLRAPSPGACLPGTNFSLIFDLGLYGVPGPVRRKEAYHPGLAYKAMDAFVERVGGHPFLYADTFYTGEAEFERVFDHSTYNRVRESYHAADAFPTLFEKVRPELDVMAACEDAAKVFDAIAAANETAILRKKTKTGVASGDKTQL